MKVTLDISSDQELRKEILAIVQGITRSELRAIVDGVINEELRLILDAKTLERRVEDQIKYSIRDNLDWNWLRNETSYLRTKICTSLTSEFTEKVKNKLGPISL